MQEALDYTEVKGEEVGEDNDGITLIDARNGFNELSRLAIIWTMSHH